MTSVYFSKTKLISDVFEPPIGPLTDRPGFISSHDIVQTDTLLSREMNPTRDHSACDPHVFSTQSLIYSSGRGFVEPTEQIWRDCRRPPPVAARRWSEDLVRSCSCYSVLVHVHMCTFMAPTTTQSLVSELQISMNSLPFTFINLIFELIDK